MLAALWIACKLVVAPLLALVAAIAVWFKVRARSAPPVWRCTVPDRVI